MSSSAPALTPPGVSAEFHHVLPATAPAVEAELPKAGHPKCFVFGF